MKCPLCGRGLTAKYRIGQHERRYTKRLRISLGGRPKYPTMCGWRP